MSFGDFSDFELWGWDGEPVDEALEISESNLSDFDGTNADDRTRQARFLRRLLMEVPGPGIIPEGLGKIKPFETVMGLPSPVGTDPPKKIPFNMG